MKDYRFAALRDCPEREKEAARWFHEKWGVPERIVGGLGVIDNDFHDRKDLSPNVCAVYTEPDCRSQGVAGRLLDMAVEDMRARGVSPIYLVTDHIGFYERYGWEFFCFARGDGETEPTRLYIHR